MKTLIFDAVGQPLRMAEQPDPTPAADEVVLRVAGCGICGSDLHITEDPAPFGIGAGFVLGHEISGEVVATGADVRDLKPGDAVAVVPMRGCGRCPRCLAGDPARCPVWQLHQVYSDDATREWAQQGCRTAGIGCIECKQPVIAGILKEQAPMRERAQQYLDDPTLVKNIIADGCEKARELARETMRDVREAMGLEYH